MRTYLYFVTTVWLAAWPVAAFAQTGDPAKGQQLFKQCAACHKVGPNGANAVGPVLNGVVGRKAASVEGYNYSPAMRKSGLTWDEPTLTQYLHNPRQVVRGTKMTFAGLKKDEDVANVIAYLKQFDATGQQASAQ